MYKLLIVLCFLPLAAAAQPGCPDPQATNYDAAASINDGSCLYASTSYTPLLVSELPNDCSEISGFTKADGKWWGHNDSGSDETFFRIEPETGDILQSVKLINAKNRDWEDMASDPQNLYIGDFGNNSNDRQNLGIYTVPLAAIGPDNAETLEESDWIFTPFAFEDQTDFSTMPEDSSVFDCEAMIVMNGKIHLFTKSRRLNTSSHYVLNPANGLAEKLESFPVEGLITGAALSPDSQLIVLTGYDLRPFIPRVFCWLLWDWEPGTEQFFSGNKRRIELGSALQTGQVESIGFETHRTGYLSNERTAFNGVVLVGESIRRIDFSAWIPETVGSTEIIKPDKGFEIFPNPFTQTVHYQGNGQKKPDFLRIKNQVGQTVLTLKDLSETLDLHVLPNGFYLFETWSEGLLTGRAKVLKQ